MAHQIEAVADTHIAVWFLWEPKRLSNRVLEYIMGIANSGGTVGLSSISLCEVLYLVERGRIRADALERMLEAVRAPDAIFEEIPVAASIVAAMMRVDHAAVPEMPDRIITATALNLGVPLLTRDRRIIESGAEVIW
jgi:PIN domain nuclease of toxin-antitoxin system